MFIPKQKLDPKVFAALEFGKTIKVKKYPGIDFVVTRLGLCTVDELQPHPYGNFYNVNAAYGKYGSQSFS